MHTPESIPRTRFKFKEVFAAFLAVGLSIPAMHFLLADVNSKSPQISKFSKTETVKNDTLRVIRFSPPVDEMEVSESSSDQISLDIAKDVSAKVESVLAQEPPVQNQPSQPAKKGPPRPPVYRELSEISDVELQNFEQHIEHDAKPQIILGDFHHQLSLRNGFGLQDVLYRARDNLHVDQQMQIVDELTQYFITNFQDVLVGRANAYTSSFLNDVFDQLLSFSSQASLRDHIFKRILSEPSKDEMLKYIKSRILHRASKIYYEHSNSLSLAKESLEKINEYIALLKYLGISTEETRNLESHYVRELEHRILLYERGLLE